MSLTNEDGEKKSRIRSYCPNIDKIDLNLLCEWEICNLTYKTMDNYLEHIDYHLMQKDLIEEFVCKWRGCEVKIAFDTKESYQRHIKFHAFHSKLKYIGSCVLNNYNEINEIKIKTCTLENKTRNYIPDLPYQFECSWNHCTFNTDNPEWFYRHVKLHYDEFKNKYSQMPKCLWGSNCNQNISNRNRLVEHIKSHTQEKICACFICGTLFATYTKFIDHCSRSQANDLQTTNTIKYQCSHCNKKFLTNNLLKEHIRKHINNVKCPLCDMTCINTNDLNKHMIYKHSEERNFKCELCESTYKTSNDLNRHMQNAHHEKEKPKKQTSNNYKCHVCDRTYSHGSTLSNHLKNVHKYKWPSGHSRFHYRLDNDGFYRLQTVRYESVKLMEQLNQQQNEQDTNVILDQGNQIDYKNDTYLIQQL